MKKRILILCYCFFLITTLQTVRSQAYANNEKIWFVGLDFNIIYNPVEDANGIFDFGENYNAAIPFRFSVEKKVRRHFGIEFSLAHNRFSKGKEVNGVPLPKDFHLVSLDGMLKSYFSDIFFDRYRSKFQTFAAGGVGVNLFDSNNGITLNLGLGGNYFITDDFLVSMQVLQKFAGLDNGLGNYAQFNIGVAFNPSKH